MQEKKKKHPYLDLANTVACFKVMSWNLLGWPEEFAGDYPWQGFETETKRLHARCANIFSVNRVPMNILIEHFCET
jgi:hypothetical protein